MSLEDFCAGTIHHRPPFETFSPSLINREWIGYDPALNVLLEQTAKALGELNAFSLLEEATVFVPLHLLKQAVAFLRVEGCAIALEDVLMAPFSRSPQTRRPSKNTELPECLARSPHSSKGEAFLP
jgi:hypothetical protein